MDRVQILIITTVFAVICAICGGIFYAAIPEGQDLFVDDGGKLFINENAVEGAKENIIKAIAPDQVAATPSPTPTSSGVTYFGKHNYAPKKTLEQPDIPEIEINFTNTTFAVVDAVNLTSPPQGSAPLLVIFAYDKQIPYTNLLWDFGDGMWSEEPYVVHEYPVSGIYRSFLTVTGVNGTEKHYVNITVGV